MSCSTQPSSRNATPLGSIGYHQPVDSSKDSTNDDYVLVRKTDLKTKESFQSASVKTDNELALSKIPDLKCQVPGPVFNYAGWVPKVIDRLKLPQSLRSVGGKPNGLKPVKIDISATIAIPNTSAGVNATKLVLDPSQGVDFASVAAVYDEMKCNAITIEYTAGSWKTATAAGGTGSSNQNYGIMAYDATDVTALSSWALGLEMTQHKCYPIGLIVTDTNPTSVMSCKATKFHIKIPKGDLTVSASGANTVMVGNAWVSTHGSYPTVCPVGELKFYEVNQLGSGIYVGGCTVSFHCEFRCRA